MRSFLISLATCFISCVLFQLYYPKRRIYCCDDGWQPIETLPDSSEEILITDGQEVRVRIYCEFNKKGQCLMSSFSGKIATHWRKYPIPPMGDK